MTDPRADALRRLRFGRAGLPRAAERRVRRQALDRAFLDAFAGRCAGGMIVDLGCGPGHVAAYLAARGARVEGLDLSPAMIDEARASHPGIEFLVGDMFAPVGVHPRGSLDFAASGLDRQTCERRHRGHDDDDDRH